MKKTALIILSLALAFVLIIKWSNIFEERGGSQKNKELTSVESSNDVTSPRDVLPTVDNPRGIAIKSGKVVATFSGEQVGLSPEGGGIGPAGISYDENGRPLIWDRLRDRIISFNEKGEVKTLAEISSSELLKGAGSALDGGILALIGSDRLSLLHFNEAGERSELAKDIATENMNAYNIVDREDGTYLIGLTQTLKIGKKGEVFQTYGVPTLDGNEYFDVELNSDGASVITFRDKVGTPLKTEVEVGHYGNVRQLTPYRNGYLVVFESDPTESDFHLNNPFYTVQLRDSSGRIINEANIPKKGTHSVDWPVSVKPDGTIVQAIANDNEVILEEYSF